uniref:Uncharacterized protein n=1 Tax=Trichogramma kaykai TaxID=54128 RepID=A0ABD2WXY6_9HYME
MTNLSRENRHVHVAQSRPDPPAVLAKCHCPTPTELTCQTLLFYFASAALLLYQRPFNKLYIYSTHFFMFSTNLFSTS